MSLARRIHIGIPLVLVAVLFSVAHAIADDSHSGIAAAAAARAALEPWDIDDEEPFGRVPNGLCLHTWNEPDERDLEFALADPNVQKLIKTRRLIALGVPSLAQLTDAGLARLRGIQGLTELSLNADSRKTLDPGFGRLKQLDSLDAIEIVGDVLVDKDLESLKTLTRLRILNLGTAVNLTGSGLSYLKDLQQLESVQLNANKLNDEGLDNLKQWPSLSSLSLGEPWDVRQSYRGASSFVPFPFWLDVQKGPGPNVDRGMRNLEHLPNLRRLELNEINITDTGLKPIRSLLRLETLRLSGLKVSEAGFASLEALKNLRSLEIRDMPTATDALAHLKALPQLEELKLLRTGLTNAEAAQLTGLKSLKRLCVTTQGRTLGDFEDSLSDRAILAVALSSMPNLVELDLIGYGSIGGSAFRGVAAHKSLRRIRLANTSISDEELRQIAPLTELEELDISRPVRHFFDQTRNAFLPPTSISDAGMKYLKGMTKLRTLNLEDTDVTDQGIAELEGLVELRQLYLPRGITNEGIMHLGKLRNLEEIRILGSKMTAKGVVFLHDHCPKLKTADFGGRNYIEDGEMQLGDYAENQYWETHSVIYADVAGTTKSGGATPQYSFDLRAKLVLAGAFDVDKTPNVSASISLKDLDPNFKSSSVGSTVLAVLVRRGDSYSISPGQTGFMPGDHAPICGVKDFDDPKVKITVAAIQKLGYLNDGAKPKDHPAKH